MMPNSKSNMFKKNKASLFPKVGNLLSNIRVHTVRLRLYCIRRCLQTTRIHIDLDTGHCINYFEGVLYSGQYESKFHFAD